MIHVEHLTKRYGRAVAVDDLSFDIEPHEIVGFLGPNGAGKTTTLRLLTGFLWPTGGEIRVAGFDVLRAPCEVKRRVGYLPEHDPLYRDMRVVEYLTYRARLKGLRGRDARRRVEEVMALCELQEVRRALIGMLSKGYCRRVGLADCLVHRPEVLILDEPTIGLDPGQVRNFRSLVQQLSDRHTVLLSSHILQVVEMLCHRVLILHRGRLVGADRTENILKLARGQWRVIAEIRGPPEETVAGLRGVAGISEVASCALGEWQRITCLCEAGADPREAVARLAAGRGWGLRELRVERDNLEDVFIALTGPSEGTAGPAPARSV